MWHGRPHAKQDHHDDVLYRFFTSDLSVDLAKTAQKMIADGGHLGHMLLRGQFAVQMDM